VRSSKRLRTCRRRRKRAPVWRSKGSQWWGYALADFAGPTAPSLRVCSLIASLCQFRAHPVTALQTTRLTFAWLGWARHIGRDQPDSATQGGFSRNQLEPVYSAPPCFCWEEPRGHNNHRQFLLQGVQLPYGNCATASSRGASRRRCSHHFRNTFLSQAKSSEDFTCSFGPCSTATDQWRGGAD
jgi:hypothetical protein